MHSRNIVPHSTQCTPIVKRLVLSGLRSKSFSGSKRAREVKEKVGLWERLRRPHNPTPHPFPTQGELLLEINVGAAYA